ncbi:MAG: carbohydrate ABC transporter permease [Candidatus Sumerlaeia bacterium]
MSHRRHETMAALLFLLPNALGFLIFSFLPIIASLTLAFFRWSPLSGMDQFFETLDFVGLKNFWGVIGFHGHEESGLFANDPYFWKYLYNTVFLMMGIPVSIMGSLILASLLNRRLRGTRLFVTVFFLPSITSGVATFAIWLGLLNPETGLMNAILGAIGIPGPDWLNSVAWAKPSLIMMGLWGSIGGYNMVLYIAALQTIPTELYEAAEIDGAGALHKFRYITWPMVSPTTFFIFTMSIIGGFQGGFAAAYIMTRGGPLGSTTSISYYIFNLAFSRNFEMGYASAVAWVLFLITFVLSVINWKYGRKKVHGELAT